MTPEQLKVSILQYAMKGKLTNQRESDDSVEELLNRIASEKEHMIQDKVMKRDKPLPPISDDEIPFQIPANWKWVRLQDLSVLINGDRGKNYPGKSHWISSGVPFVNAGSLVDGKVSLNRVNFISEQRFSLLRSGFIRTNDILYTLRGSIGKVAINASLNRGAIASSLVIVRPIIDISSYLLIVLQSSLGKLFLEKKRNGTAQPNISATDLKTFIVPIPPLAEQERILKKIEILMSKVDTFKVSYRKLNHLNNDIRVKMRASLLSAISSGQLIQSSSSKIQASTKYPFSIPFGWTWMKLSEVAKLSLGKTPDSKNRQYWGGNIPWITIKDIQAGKVQSTTQRMITPIAVKEKMGEISPAGTLIMSFKLSIGKVAILPVAMYHNEAIVSINIVNNKVTRDWLYLVLPQMVLYAETAGAVKGKTLNKKKLNDLWIPVPPLMEQETSFELYNHLITLIS